MATIEERSYYNMDFGYWYESLGQGAREEFTKWLGTLRDFKPIRSKSINYDFGISYCNDLFMAGRSMVYLYTDKNGVPFYVGKGDSSRAVSIYNRSDAFKEKLSESDTCRIFAVAFDVMEKYALEVETLVINELINRGWRLTNRSKVCISQSEMNKLRNDYPEVLDALNSISRTAIDFLLGDTDNAFGNGVEVRVCNKTNVRKVES